MQAGRAQRKETARCYLRDLFLVDFISPDRLVPKPRVGNERETVVVLLHVLFARARMYSPTVSLRYIMELTRGEPLVV